MAGRYLPTELQNADGDVVYPHTEADIVFMQDGRNVEEVLKSKMEMVVSNVAIPVEQRKAGIVYVFIDGETAVSEAAAAMASPSVGYRMI